MAGKETAVTEYMQLLMELADYLKSQDGLIPGKKQLTGYIEKLSEKSVDLNVFDKTQQLCDDTRQLCSETQQLFNRAQYLKNVRFYFPTANYQKRERYKAHILIISHEMGRSGAPVVLMDAVRILKDEGYFVYVVSPMDGPLCLEMNKEGIPVMVDFSLLNGRCEPDEIRSVNPYQNWVTDLFVKSFDMTICNTAVLHNVVERYMHYGKPLLWWMHEGNMSFASFGHYLPGKLPENVKVAYVCDYVREQAELYKIHYPGTVLHYGVSEEIAEEKTVAGDKVGNDEACGNIKNDNRTIYIIVGAIDKRKGQDLLLDAILNLPEDYLNKAEFWFVGHAIDKDLYNRIEMLSEGMEQIKLWRSMPREQLLKLYQECDCIICCSRDDPLPVVVTEAMILKKVSICSEHTGTAAYLEDGVNGFVCKNEDVDDLEKKICEVMDQKAHLSDIAEKAYDLYKTHFTMDIFQKNLLELVGDIFNSDDNSDENSNSVDLAGDNI